MAKPPKRMSATRGRGKAAKMSKVRRVKTPVVPKVAPGSAREPESLRGQYERLKREHDLLEAKTDELKEANEELSRERVALRERAAVIEKRYTDLVERSARGEPRPALPASDAERQSARQRLDQSRREREEASKKKEFWMVCPKCGERLEEVERDDVKVERCRACAGIYLDKGELETIAATSNASSIFQSLRALFG
jgi:ribosomal protein L37AE/L43A